MTRLEAVAWLKAALGSRCRAFTDPELGGFAERLHDDPILRGLFGRLLGTDPSVTPLSVCDGVIGRVATSDYRLVTGDLELDEAAFVVDTPEKLRGLFTTR